MGIQCDGVMNHTLSCMGIKSAPMRREKPPADQGGARAGWLAPMEVSWPPPFSETVDAADFLALAIALEQTDLRKWCLLGLLCAASDGVMNPCRLNVGLLCAARVASLNLSKYVLEEWPLLISLADVGTSVTCPSVR